MSHGLMFLHLSDIHFTRPTKTSYDPDLDLRRELVTDVVRMKEKVGACSGVLVSGDIAYSGNASEYARAEEWLRELCHELGCAAESVWVIPGNHDVDRDKFRNSSIIQDKHQRLRTGDAGKGELEREIKRIYDDSEAFDALHRAFSDYSKFAGSYGCSPAKGSMHWEDDLPLNDGSTLRIRGCNSALVSRGNPKDDENENRLVVGRQQMLPPNDDGVTHLIMCHHPLDWLHDRDEIKKGLKARVHVALFGHKHELCVEQLDNLVVIVAGAVHPDREEAGWQPRYNFVSVVVEPSKNGRNLTVEVWPRRWDDVNKRFVADFDPQGSERRQYRLALPQWNAPPPDEPSELAMGRTEVTSEGTIMSPKRRLVYRFHQLPYVRRLQVVTKLDLVADEDEGLKDMERYPLYFRRAESKGILDKLWLAVEQQHGVDLPGANPFSKNT